MADWVAEGREGLNLCLNALEPFLKLLRKIDEKRLVGEHEVENVFILVESGLKRCNAGLKSRKGRVSCLALFGSHGWAGGRNENRSKLFDLVMSRIKTIT